jgi:hypothetical protein
MVGKPTGMKPRYFASHIGTRQRQVGKPNMKLSRAVESRRLALPDVLAAWARHRLSGLLLGHRLLADGTISAPHYWISLFFN